MNKPTILLTIAAAAVLAGCASTPPPSVPYSGGDACEWAKQNLIQATAEYHEHIGKFYPDDIPIIGAFAPRSPAVNAAYKYRAARADVNAMCKEEEEKDGAWACAEGHSCK